MQLIQSYIFSVARVSLSVIEQRILLHIVQSAQSYAKADLVKNMQKGQPVDIDNVRIVMQLRDVLSNKSCDTSLVVDAVKSLESRVMSYYDSVRKEWQITPLIYNCRYQVGSGQVSFYVSRSVFQAMLDFSKGFRQYDYDVAMSLSSAYAVRFYILFCRQTKPVEWSIVQLRNMFCLTDEYTQTRDFIKRVVEQSKQLLDKKGCNTFSYKVNKRGGRIVSITFYPITKESNESTLTAKLSVSNLVSKALYVMLTSDAGFTYNELARNKTTLSKFEHVPECLSVLVDIINRSMVKERPKGYIIAAMKAEILALDMVRKQ